ncbi:iron-containing alcohol dehydrogenase [Halobacillus shinanisalinarum]|uniref:Iron-containing alcohol dehydrogenase n=1 Tax=Halobacillus shinanisalinarum TaxID=2932258 RepID=A0ABY4H2S4_9BACI|nr:iron-containing alcohol dehydrogenase [Halobacillus shinanisalinarum]UOQ94751.1 iron-containing alcohol dehydrogenase [Halobacillus shinanisalinarum]
MKTINQGTIPTMNFSVSVDIKIGAGASKEVGVISKDLGVEKVLCIYDEGIKSAGISNNIVDSLQNEGIKVSTYDKVTPNPPDSIVTNAAEFARKQEIDGIVAIGGGSSIDCAKAVNILLTNPGPIHQYEGKDQVEHEVKPIIAIPTTAGTGSEVTSVTVVTNSEKSRKMIIAGQGCGATTALLDPELTVGLPANVTAGTGMDALTHALEAYISKGASVLTDINALKAIELISKNLYESTVNGTNLQARSNMLIGSLLAGIAFNSAGLGLVHAISHPISSHCGVPHGIANATLLPHVLAFNGEDEKVQDRLRDVASIMGISIVSKGGKETIEHVVEKVSELCEKVNIPRLRDVGVETTEFSQIAADALKEKSMTFTPRKAMKEDIVRILESAY